MPACGDGVVGVLATAGFRSRAVCGPKMRARPGGSVSRARRARGGGKPRRGGRRSTGQRPTRLLCMNCSFYRFGYKIFAILVRPKKSRRPRLRARACNRVFQKRSEARARVGLLRTLLLGEISSVGLSREADRVCFLGRRANRFFSSAASAGLAGGALESDGTAASSFPLVSGILGLLEALLFVAVWWTDRAVVGARD